MDENKSGRHDELYTLHHRIRLLRFVSERGNNFEFALPCNAAASTNAAQFQNQREASWVEGHENEVVDHH